MESKENKILQIITISIYALLFLVNLLRKDAMISGLAGIVLLMQAIPVRD